MRVAQDWRLKAQRYRLEGIVCQRCGQAIFPPRPRCPQCQERITVEAVIPTEIVLPEVAAVELERERIGSSS